MFGNFLIRDANEKIATRGRLRADDSRRKLRGMQARYQAGLLEWVLPLQGVSDDVTEASGSKELEASGVSGRLL